MFVPAWSFFSVSVTDRPGRPSKATFVCCAVVLIWYLLLAVAERADALVLVNNHYGVLLVHRSAASNFVSSPPRRFSTMCRFFKKGETPDPRVDQNEEKVEVMDAAGADGESNGSKSKPLTWNPLRLAVLRLGLTEPAMTSPLNYGTYNGIFTCAYCGVALFDSTAKYDSGTGWPSFWRTAVPEAVAYQRDLTGLECHCAHCDSHLGHVFLDGPRPSTVPFDLLRDSPESDPRGAREDAPLPRYCINGAALNYRARDTTVENSD